MTRSVRCLFNAKFSDFLATESKTILGNLCDNYNGAVLTSQIDAWKHEIEILKNIINKLPDKNGKIIFEYDIPRLGKRIDVLLLYKGIIFCLEFKVGEYKILQSDIDQVLDYALDLKNFHKFSNDKIIVPILIATEYGNFSQTVQISAYNDKVINPLVSGETNFLALIEKVLDTYPNETNIDDNWIISPYSPTPTIIEAAKRLYQNHSVEDITRHEADDVSTDNTIKYIIDIIQRSKHNQEKSICFVTGVPGAGKTLVGLDVAVKQTYQGLDKPNESESAVYLSGNGPLVAILNEALAKDNFEKCKAKGQNKKISDSRREVSKFIQIIHRYRDNMLAKIKTPIVNQMLEIDPQKAIKLEKSGYGEVEHVAIFDEAQRSWTKKRLADYLKRGGTYGNKLKIENFPFSEAAFLIWSLDQRQDWATIVCLIGVGQEINTGEAGISEWIKALNEFFPHWKIYISPKLIGQEHEQGVINQLLQKNNNVNYSKDLHLNVSIRSFRAEKLSNFVNVLLNLDVHLAKSIFDEIKDKYPIILTRDFKKAKQWLHQKARGNEKTGVLITKEAARFKPLGIHVLPSGDENAVHWFLEDKIDTRSSNYLEDAATEIQVQGLEIDYACVLWDADMRYIDNKWRFYKFNGQTKWNEQVANTESKSEAIKYMLNAYRVLLTRARQGMIICIPKGNSNKNSNGYWEDSTRLPEYYDSTYQYFKSLGLKEI